jgi:hypothetical protein
VSTVGDGVHYAALALLAVSLTRDPRKCRRWSSLAGFPCCC